MFEFEISSPFKAYNYTRVIQKDAIYIGRNAGDIIFPDRSFKNAHFYIEIIGNDILLHPDPELDFFHLNNKRASKIKKIKIGDTISHDQITIKLKSALAEPVTDYDDYLKKIEKQWVDSKHPILEIYLKLKNQK